MGCPHCMHNATPEPQHATDETVDLGIEFAKRIGTKCVLVSGGEPTMNPNWVDMTSRVASAVPAVMIATNGTWLGNDDEEGKMIDLLKRHANIKIQITSLRGLYREYERITSQYPNFTQKLKANKLKHRSGIVRGDATEIRNMLALGRAIDHEPSRKMADENPYVMSCFQAAHITCQAKDLEKTISVLESRIHFCHPIVDWKGDIHWSESILCPAFGNVREEYDILRKKAVAWRPCGKCHGYQKFIAKTDMDYVMARVLMAMP